MSSKEKRYAILIGSNNYEANQFQFSLKDVDDVKNILISKCNFNEENIFSLKIEAGETELTTPKIVECFESVKKKFTRNTDMFFFFFSGHGFYEKNESHSYLELSDSENISIQEIWDKIKDLNADNTYMMIDACYSGGDLILTSKSKDNRLFLQNSEGIYCIFGASKEHKAFEPDRKTSRKQNIENGFLTHYFIEILNKKERYNSGDGTISINGIKDYVFYHTEKITGFTQIPVAHSFEKGYHPFGIWKDFNKELKENETLETAIISKFNQASVDLIDVKDHFHNLEDSHIEREEVKKIFDWIKEKNNKQLAVLLGKAGFGKSVIFKDIFLKLQAENIPVLGLKADRLSFSKKEDLLNEIKLNEEDIRVIAQSENISTVVILIDQIDALSQSLSADREPIKVYTRLIHQLLNISNKIKVIVSCRTFDLNHDQELQKLKADSQNKIQTEKFNIQELGDDYVKQILSRLEINVDQANSKFKKLMKVPQNLDVFCRVFEDYRTYGEDLNINSINTLNDLYDKLWEDKFKKVRGNVPFNPENTEKLLYEIAEDMYQLQKIIIPKRKFELKNYNEFVYIQSQDIISTDNKQLQFFHQTFFDYVLARNFVESGRLMSKELQNTHQGLFIRSSVRQVISYLRDSHESSYINEIQTILFGNYRYHIQLLIIQQLASETNLKGVEQNFVQEIILKSDKYKDLFITSIISEDWFEFFRDKKFLQALIQENERGYNLVWGLCSRIGRQNSKLIYSFLANLPEFEKKDNFIINQITQIKDFSSNESMELLNRYKEQLKTEDSRFYYLFGDILKYHPDWIFHELFEDLKEYQPRVTDHSSDKYVPSKHRTDSLYSDIYKIYPDNSYDFFKKALKLIVESHPYQAPEDHLIHDQAFSIYDERSIRGRLPAHYYFFNIIINHLKRNIDSQRDFVVSEVNEYLDSNYVTFLNIALSVMIDSPELFAGQTFELLTREYLLEESNYPQFFSYQVREIINVTYPFFSEEQKSLINTIILNLNLSKDVQSAKFYKQSLNPLNPDRYRYTVFGDKKYSLISSIPESERVKFSEVHKKYQELFRKFGPRKNESPQYIFEIESKVPAIEICKKMSLKNWKQSFDKIGINRQTHPELDAWDVIDHKRNFSKTIEELPEKLYPLIQEMIQEKSIHINFIIAGLEGLQKANYKPEQILAFHKEMIKRDDLNNRQIYLLLSLTEYFIKNETFDREIIEFIGNNLLNNPDSGNISNNLNSVKGLSAHLLIECSLKREYSDYIFDTIESAVTLELGSVEVSLLHNLAYLMNLNKERTLEIFLKLTKSITPDHIDASIWSLNYFLRFNFSKLVPFFEKCLDFEENTELAELIFIAWLKGNEKSQELLEKYLAKGEKSLVAVLRIAIQHITIEEFKEKCQEFFYPYLKSESKEISSAFEFSFYRFESNEFENIFKFLEDYIDSNVGKQRSHTFYDYLKKCTSHYPDKCIYLIKKEDSFLLSTDYMESYEHKEALNVLIDSYNAIRKYNSKAEILEDSMDFFDKMLQSNLFSNSSRDVLREIDD